MKQHLTDNPAKLLGTILSDKITTHTGDIVCLLSGGSALDIVDYISFPDTSECRTILFMMGDERGSREASTNNFLQLQTRYPNHSVTTHLVKSVPEENESLEEFAARIEKTFLEKISKFRQPKILHILGVGTDGHTAGIFPMTKESFQEVYRDDQTYVPVHLEGLTIDSRASFTPIWILNHVDELFVYIVGKAKQNTLKSLLNETKPIHERPAELIKQHRNAEIFTDISID